MHAVYTNSFNSVLHEHAAGPPSLFLPAAGDEPVLVLRREHILEGTWAPGSLHGVEVPNPLQGSAASGLML